MESGRGKEELPGLWEFCPLVQRGILLIRSKGRHGPGMRDAVAPQAVVLSRINHVKPI